jgi:plasmid stabilization system protein ParE
MSILNEAVRHLCEDLFGSGIDNERIAGITALYADALKRQAPEVWMAFYDAMFQALRALAARPQEFSQREARESLLRIIEDDLGSALYGNAVVELRDQLNLRYERSRATVA